MDKSTEPSSVLLSFLHLFCSSPFLVVSLRSKGDAPFGGLGCGFLLRDRRLLRCDAAVEVEQLAGRRLPGELRGTREAVGRLICADLPVGFEP